MDERESDRRLNQIEHWRRTVIRLARQSEPREWQDLQDLCNFLWEMQGGETPSRPSSLGETRDF